MGGHGGLGCFLNGPKLSEQVREASPDQASPPPGALAEALRAAGQGAESGAVLLPWLASLPHRDSVQMCGAPARDPVDSRPLLPPVPLGTWSPDSVRAVS